VVIFPLYIPVAHVQKHSPWSWRHDDALAPEGIETGLADGEAPPAGTVAYRKGPSGRLESWRYTPQH
jgi:hypothetical protein